MIETTRFIFEKDRPFTFNLKCKIEDEPHLIRKDEVIEISKTFQGFEKLFEKRTEAGHLCFGARLNGKYVHLEWVAFERVFHGEIERYITLPPDSVCVYDVYTIPEYRGLGIASSVTEKAFEYLSGLKVNRIYSCAGPTNYPSLRVKQKEDYGKIGTVTYLRESRLKLYIFRCETGEDMKRIINMYSLKHPIKIDKHVSALFIQH